MERFAEIVPELYYDVIGRLFPGALASLAVVWLWQPTAPAQFDGFIAVALAVAMAYSVGLVLDFAGVSVGRANRVIRRLLAKLPQFDRDDRRALDSVDPWPVARTLTAARSAIIVKMMAERLCLRSLGLIAFALWVCGFSFVKEGWGMAAGATTPPQSLSLLLAVILLAAQYRWDFLARLNASQFQREAAADRGKAAPSTSSE
jgi:hypothetical protein